MSMKNSALSLFVLITFALGILSLILIYSLRLANKPIRSDGIGYYLYLPGVLLFQDIGMNEVARRNFPGAKIPPWSGATKWKDSGKYFIKYPMGEALLMVPFFVIATVVEGLAGGDFSGFSWPFQVMAALSGLIYGVLGIILLWKLLEIYFRKDTVLWAMIGIVFGTGLFHYATYDAIYSHVYSFFLCAAFLWMVRLAFVKKTPSHFLLSGLLAGGIVITRYTNGVMLIGGLLFGIHSVGSVLHRVAWLKEHGSKLLLAVLGFGVMVFFQMAYWKAITGSFLVYSYGNERFIFDQPEILNVLFSVRKGLFFWWPVLLSLIPGIFLMKRYVSSFWLSTLVILLITLYLFSTWEYWWCGGSFGFRRYVDFLPFFALAFCSLFEATDRSRIWRKPVRGLVSLSVLVSVMSMIKYWTGVIPIDGTTWNLFVKNLFVLW